MTDERLNWFMAGNEPPVTFLTTAWRLEEWKPAFVADYPKPLFMTLEGMASIGAKPPEERRYHVTGRIWWVDRKLRWCRAEERLYALGDPK
jgi:hypothetical protein